MLGHTPQCSGVSTQVLAECTPALAGEGRKNQSLLVPNVLERAEERRSTLEGVSESRTGRGETEASGSPHRLAKGKQRSTPAWTWVRRAPARRSRPTRSAGTSLIIQTQWSLASGPPSQSHTRTRHTAPRARPLPRPGGKEMRRWDSKGGATNTYGRFQLCATLPGVSHFPGQPRPFEAGK